MYGIEERYKRRGPPYHMITHALQTQLHLNKKYVSDVQITRACIQNRLLQTGEKSGGITNKKYILLGCNNISNTSVFFII